MSIVESLKAPYKYLSLNHDHKNLANWLKANKNSVTKTYGRYTNVVNAIYAWNHFQSCHQDYIFHQLSTYKLKEIMITFFLNRCN